MKKLGNTKIRNENQNTIITFHYTDILTFNNEKIIINHGGFTTKTTKERLNLFSKENNLGFSIHQENYSWIITYKGEKIPMIDKSIELRR